MTDLTLKPCPFCGGKSTVTKWFSATASRPDWWVASCVFGCGSSSEEMTREFAIAAWNRRPEPSPAPVWRDIQTAPKDRMILVFAPGEDPRWPDRLDDLIVTSRWHPDAGFCVCELREPSHWMPLPAPPLAKAEQIAALGRDQGAAQSQPGRAPAFGAANEAQGDLEGGAS